MTAWLVLEDGTAFPGRSVGASGEAFGEAVFNTSLTGYQEVLTDPSYKGQIVAMTNPHIGNYGVNEEDAESRRPWVEGFVMRELSPVASNFRSSESLDTYLKRHGVVALDGIDTRCLTLKLRQQGSMRCGMSTTEPDPEKLLARVRSAPEIVGVDLVKEVTCEAPYEWPPVRSSELRVTSSELTRNPQPATRNLHVVVMDFGVKYSTLGQLAAQGCKVTVLPASTTAAEVLARTPDGVLLSNGPGDPAAVPYAVNTIRQLMGQVPIFGICLGHQLLGLAYGAQTYKLKFGHHGGNHPVQDLSTKKVEITCQNHNFAVNVDTIAGGPVEMTHVNLNDQTVEGMKHKTLPIISLQYHPESAPGPHDARYMFGRFKELIESNA